MSEPSDRRWFAVNWDGELHELTGMSEDSFDAADERSEQLGLQSVWIVDPELAEKWRRVLSGVPE